MKESAIEKHFVDAAKKCGFRAIKFVDPSRRGAPDRIVLGPYHMVAFVEFKAGPSSKTSEAQRAYQRWLEDQHFILYNCDSIRSADEILLELVELTESVSEVYNACFTRVPN